MNSLDVFVHYSYSGSSEGTISMQEGEVLAVVEEDKGDGWTRVRRNNGDEGYIPTSYANITLNKWPRRFCPWHEEQLPIITAYRLAQNIAEKEKKREIETCHASDTFASGQPKRAWERC